MSRKNGAITYSFRNIPQEVYKIILREQNRIKLNKGVSQFSLEQTIYTIIRDWDKIKEAKLN